MNYKAAHARVGGQQTAEAGLDEKYRCIRIDHVGKETNTNNKTVMVETMVVVVE